MKELARTKQSQNYQTLLERVEAIKKKVQAAPAPPEPIPDNDPAALFHKDIQRLFAQVDKLTKLSQTPIVQEQTEDFSADVAKLKELESQASKLKAKISDLKKQFDDIPQEKPPDSKAEIAQTKAALKSIKKELTQAQSQVADEYRVHVNKLDEVHETVITNIDETIYSQVDGGTNSHIAKVSNLKKELRGLKKKLASVEHQEEIVESTGDPIIHKIDLTLFAIIILGAFLFGFVIRGKGSSKK